MNRLDQELEEALSANADEAEGYSAPLHPETVPVHTAEKRRGYWVLAGLMGLAGAILLLVFSSVEGNAIYSKGVDELVRERSEAAGSADAEWLYSRQTRVEGVLVKGSLTHRQDPCEYRFKLERNGSVIDVHYPQCSVPDTFRDVPDVDVQVTAEGTLGQTGEFQATQIMAKCPSKYEMKQAAENGESAPHAFPMLGGDLPDNYPSR